MSTRSDSSGTNGFPHHSTDGMAGAMEGEQSPIDDRFSKAGAQSPARRGKQAEFRSMKSPSDSLAPSGFAVIQSEEWLTNNLCQGDRSVSLQALDVEATHSDPERRGSSRYLIFLLSTAILICYADRSNISSAIIPMATEFGWSETQKGLILSSFFAGYAITQSIGGYWADTAGGKLVLLVGVVSWSFLTFITPSISNLGIPALLAGRVGLGLGEGLAFPAAHSIISEHVHETSQSIAVGTVTAASYFGVSLAFGLTPTIIIHDGWRAVFCIFGSLAVVWVPLWLFYDLREGTVTCKPSARSVRRKHAGKRRHSALSMPGENQVTAGQRQGSIIPARPLVIGAGHCARQTSPPAPNSPSEARDEDLRTNRAVEAEQLCNFPENSSGEDAVERSDRSLKEILAELLAHKAVWAIIVCQYCQSWGMYGLLSWLPTFLQQVHGVVMADLGIYTTIPYICQGATAVLSGHVADFLIGKGCTTRNVRLSLQGISMLTPGPLFLLSSLSCTTATQVSFLDSEARAVT